MTVNKRKKNSRQRGSWTHGWGEKKKHRGSGNRGGSGMSGTGKRADSKKPSIWKDPHYFGKHGFTSLIKSKINAQNIGYIEANIEKLIKKNLVKKEGEYYVIDAKGMGFNKLLGKGRLTKKYKIDVPYASKKAVEIVHKAGGIVNCMKKKEDKKVIKKEDV